MADQKLMAGADQKLMAGALVLELQRLAEKVETELVPVAGQIPQQDMRFIAFVFVDETERFNKLVDAAIKQAKRG